MERDSVICPELSLAAAGLIGAERVHSHIERIRPRQGAAMYPVLTSLLAASGGSNIQLDPSQGLSLIHI